MMGKLKGVENSRAHFADNQVKLGEAEDSVLLLKRRNRADVIGVPVQETHPGHSVVSSTDTDGSTFYLSESQPSLSHPILADLWGNSVTELKRFNFNPDSRHNSGLTQQVPSAAGNINNGYDCFHCEKVCNSFLDLCNHESTCESIGTFAPCSFPAEMGNLSLASTDKNEAHTRILPESETREVQTPETWENPSRNSPESSTCSCCKCHTCPCANMHQSGPTYHVSVMSSNSLDKSLQISINSGDHGEKKIKPFVQPEVQFPTATKSDHVRRKLSTKAVDAENKYFCQHCNKRFRVKEAWMHHLKERCTVLFDRNVPCKKAVTGSGAAAAPTTPLGDRTANQVNKVHPRPVLPNPKGGQTASAASTRGSVRKPWRNYRRNKDK